MLRTPITPDLTAFPDLIRPLLTGANLYDSSCSPQARVFYIEKDGGYFLKRSPKGTLEREALMTRYFHSLGFGAAVLAYESLDEDWLLTRRVAGEDMTHASVLSDPIRLCDTLAECLRMLHALPADGCPVADHTACYLATAEENYREGLFDPSFADLPDLTPDGAWERVRSQGHLLQNDTLLHGDYCLPNIMLEDWRFRGFIDLGNGGIGDRHVDLFWGAWTLRFNLKTDRYRQRFFDAYGRDRVDPERLALVGIIETFG
jgi:kanamycin kinase